ncbi:MAG: DUF4332 domain-containing protein [Anaerolineae bacterium]|jgi:hypothetical protein
MNEEEFAQFLKRGGRSERARQRVLRRLAEYEQYLRHERCVSGLEESSAEDLEAFVVWLEREGKTSANSHLWAIKYGYEYVGNEELYDLARILREQRIQRKPFGLKGFMDVRPEHVDRLAELGIHNVQQMLQAGRTPDARQQLAGDTGLPSETISELVKLSDLSRIPGIKGIRARLYHDAGVDTVEKMAAWNPQELRAMLVKFVERTGFEGIAPLPAEIRFSINTAQGLEPMVEY